MGLYRYTDTELKQLLKSMVVLIDTREQKNFHLLDYFKEKDIPWKSKKLNYGDYSAYLPKCEELGLMRDLYFDHDIVIERKASLEELAGNLTSDRQRFKNELTRASSSQFHLMVEGGSYAEVINAEYLVQLSPQAYLASLLSLQVEYGFNLHFVEKHHAGLCLYRLLYYYIRKQLIL